MNQDQKLQMALAIVEKYGMKGDVIYREIEALSDTETVPQKCEECHGTGRVEEEHKVDNSGRTVEAFGCCDSCEGTGEVLTAQQAAPSQVTELPQLPEGKCVVRGPASAFNNPESGSLVDFDCEGPLSHCPEDGEELFTADQMREYARTTLLEASSQREQPAAKPDLFLEMGLDQPAFSEVKK